jgi:hypothetical protein
MRLEERAIQEAVHSMVQALELAVMQVILELYHITFPTIRRPIVCSTWFAVVSANNSFENTHGLLASRFELDKSVSGSRRAISGFVQRYPNSN